MKKILVVFEDDAQALSNLQLALKAARAAGPDTQVKILLPEACDAPEAPDTTNKLEMLRKILVREKFNGATLEVINGSEAELTWLLARRANGWNADEVYLSAGKPCLECASQEPRRSFFGKLRARPEPSPAISSVIEAEPFTRLVQGKVIFTCHGERLMSVQTHYAKARIKVSEPDYSSTTLNDER